MLRGKFCGLEFAPHGVRMLSLRVAPCISITYSLHFKPPIAWSVVSPFSINSCHFSLSSFVLLDSAKLRAIRSSTLSSRLFFCLPSVFAPFTGPWWIVFASLNEQETCSYCYGIWLLFDILFVVASSIFSFNLRAITVEVINMLL